MGLSHKRLSSCNSSTRQLVNFKTVILTAYELAMQLTNCSSNKKLRVWKNVDVLNPYLLQLQKNNYQPNSTCSHSTLHLSKTSQHRICNFSFKQLGSCTLTKFILSSNSLNQKPGSQQYRNCIQYSHQNTFITLRKTLMRNATFQCSKGLLLDWKRRWKHFPRQLSIAL